MSTFGGKIEEIPEISVDRFDGDNLNSQAFFLSHCHTDHMRGLFAHHFQEKIKNEKKFIYVSPVSRAILNGMCPNISGLLKELSIEFSTSILVNNKSISVTCIPAGHCPGSVMFLFEVSDCRILYTGDYRIGTSDISKFKCFYDSFNNVKSIDKIYLDTTFFLKNFESLPKREDSMMEISKIILNWTSQSPDNAVRIDTKARYGYEYAFKEIYERCKMPVHVNNENFKFYSLIPELDKAVTQDGASTQIHCCYYRDKDICPFISPNNLRTIKISAFRWRDYNFKDGLSVANEKCNYYYVCYSTHASYEEGLALIDFLKPKAIQACVEHEDPAVNEAMMKLIKEKIVNVTEKILLNAPKLFNVDSGTIYTRPKKILKSDWSVLDSPPR
ncbi:protein artemis [Cylas formicarius]|uniref:protein artemis n=1 Tax=Cylas formicarius TaxID=197179 RepID=UPI002958C3A6|nr:protein artemis [Cylas formicarius]